MTYVIENLAPAHAVIQVTHTGAVTASDMRAIAKQVGEMTSDASPRLVLSDFSAATDLPGAIELLTLLEALGKADVGDGFKQALIWPTDPQARIALDVWRTGETNEGLNGKAFGDRESALAWLEG